LLAAGMPIKARYLPDATQRAVLDERYRRFQGLLEAAKGLRA
jgi:xylulokinase